MIIASNRIIEVRQNNLEPIRIGRKTGRHRKVEVYLFLISVKYLFKPAALAFHQIQTAENIRKERIAPDGWDILYIVILNFAAIIHSAGRNNLDPVIIDIQMDFAAGLHVVAMNDGIDQNFKNCPFRIIGKRYPLIRQFFPSNMSITLKKRHCFRELGKHTTGIFSVIEGINRTIRFIETIPAGAEYSGLPKRRIVGEQKGCITQFACRIDQSKRDKILIVEAGIIFPFIHLLKQGKTIIGKFFIAEKGIKCRSLTVDR